jgi:hypothetical protein
VELSPPASQLLNVWEQGRSQTQVQRAFSLLALALPGQPTDELGGFSIGRRDRELLGLREQLFGSRLASAATCPSCGLEIEMDFSVSDIRITPVPDPGHLHSLQIDGYDMSFRLPTCGDLSALTPNTDAREGKTLLLERCIAEIRVKNETLPAAMLPETIAHALSERMAQLDPQGDIQLTLSCPKCDHQWVSPLDIVSYLWREIHAWAARTLREIHTIAAAYGWNEAEILALSPRRRQTYLEMIES